MSPRSYGTPPGARGGIGRAATLAALLLVLLAAAPVPAAAQDRRGLMFVGGVAYERGGPGPSLVDGLAAAGLDDEKSPTVCLPGAGCAPVQYPFYFDDGLNLAAMVGARYRFDLPLSIEALVSNGQRGHAEGYRQEQYDEILVTYASFLLTTTLGLHLGPVRLEAGPAVNTTFWGASRRGSEMDRSRRSRVGAAAGVGVGFPLGDVVVSVRAGGRGFPSTDLGEMLHVPLEAEYQSFYVGVTVLPGAD